jgi:hypothetical protein
VRFLGFTLIACSIAILPSILPRTGIAHAAGATGTCRSHSHADAHAFDNSGLSGSADGGVMVDGYTQDDCLGLAETDAIFQAGMACENAGIPAGLAPGLGYAVVTWVVAWTDDLLNEPWGTGAPWEYQQSQYDCADTFAG